MRTALVLAALAACGSDPKEGTDDPLPDALFAASQTGEIFELDPNTGEATSVVTPRAEGALLGRISAMEYSVEDQVWFVGTGGKAPCPGCLYNFDWKTNTTTRIELNGDVPEAFAGLCINPGDGELYATLPSDDGAVFVYDDRNGSVTRIEFDEGTTGEHGKGCAFPTSNRMLIAGDLSLSSLNISTRTVSTVGFLSYLGTEFTNASVTVGSMSNRINSSRIYVLVKDGGGSGSSSVSFLGELDTTSGAVRIVGTTGRPLDGLVFVPGEVGRELRGE